MISDKNTSTLLDTERRYAPVVLALYLTCTAYGAMLLWLRASFLAVVGWLVLAASNACYLLQHGHPTVGMAPVAVFSLMPATIPLLLAPDTRPFLRMLCAAAFMLSLCTAILFGVWFCRIRHAYARRRHIDDDAIVIVLGGAVRNGLPRPTLARRLDVAERLCNEHAGIVLILSGGPLPYERGTEADAMARYLMERGVPRSRLLLEQRARNTRDNIAYGLEIVHSTGKEVQVCVLSSDFHLYRAVREGRRLGVEFTPIPAPTSPTSFLQQWCREVLTILAKR